MTKSLDGGRQGLPEALRPSKRVRKIFKIRASKVLQVVILEYDQSLVSGAGGDGSSPVAA